MTNIRNNSISKSNSKTNTRNLTQAVTANRLSDGYVVYLTDSDSWSERISDCQTVDDGSAADDLLRRATHRAADDLVVGPYLFKVATEGNRTIPIGQREILRTTGPSVGTDLNPG